MHIGTYTTNNFTSALDAVSVLLGGNYVQFRVLHCTTVNDLVENAFIPNIEHGKVKALFEQGLQIFKAHEEHAVMMVKSLK